MGTCATVVFTDETEDASVSYSAILAPEIIVASGSGYCLPADILYVSGIAIFDEHGIVVGVDDLQDETGSSLLTD